MSLSAAEQYLLELMNRARLDPAGEALRMGIDLNQGLAAGQISTAAKQVLAPNALLEAAATGHSLWMLSADIFSHTGLNGSSGAQRILEQGYTFDAWGENLALTGTTATGSLQAMIDEMNKGLFLSQDHRLNLMAGGFREIGVGVESGVFTQGGHNFNSEALTLNFGTLGTAHFLTGVAYTDSNLDRFYTIGEGIANVTFKVGAQTVGTADAGGYSLALGSGAVAVTGQFGTRAFSVTVDMAPGNVKLDLVSGTTFYTSGSLVLGSGVNNVLQLGVGAVQATGNTFANVLTGNSGANALLGMAGRDVLAGNAGADRLNGNAGADRLNGGIGNDLINGGRGNDMLIGGTGIDTFVFNAGDGLDRISDYSIAGKDVLRLDHNLWAGQTLTAGDVITMFLTQTTSEAVFDFGSGQQLHLTGLSGHFGLSGLIEIF